MDRGGQAGGEDDAVELPPVPVQRSAEIAAFNNRGANTGRIGTAHNWDLLNAGDFGGAVPRFAFRGCPVNFYQLGEVYAVAERLTTSECVAWNRI
jgi:hypothetical protein